MPKITITLDTGEIIDHNIVEEKVTLGRANDNMIVVKDGSISGHHAEFIKEGNNYRIYDLGSTNGSRVDGEVANGSLLNHGSQLILGYVMATYSTQEGEILEKKKIEIEESKVEDLKKTQKIILEAPPEVEHTNIEIAKVSAKPIDFQSMSPFKKKEVKKDPIKTLMVSVSILAIIFSIVLIVMVNLKL